MITIYLVNCSILCNIDWLNLTIIIQESQPSLIYVRYLISIEYFFDRYECAVSPVLIDSLSRNPGLLPHLCLLTVDIICHFQFGVIHIHILSYLFYIMHSPFFTYYCKFHNFAGYFISFISFYGTFFHNQSHHRDHRSNQSYEHLSFAGYFISIQFPSHNDVNDNSLVYYII